ncbi:MAG: hypothetical protein DSY57_06260 [Desulfobulbus sp.]|nr:MAG: hypothetical protein DSY57_06260 [Desulfobulbus sp.]
MLTSLGLKAFTSAPGSFKQACESIARLCEQAGSDEDGVLVNAYQNINALYTHRVKTYNYLNKRYFYIIPYKEK